MTETITEFKREIMLIDADKKLARIKVEVTFRNGYPELSMSARYDGSCGQCLDRIKIATEDQLRLIQIWNNHHLKEIDQNIFDELVELVERVDYGVTVLNSGTQFTDPKDMALAKYLKITPNDAKNLSCDIDVLTEEEADEKASENIEDSLWAFNIDFIIKHAKKGKALNDALGFSWDDMDEDTDPEDIFHCHTGGEALEDYLKKRQVEECEDFNEVVKSIIADLEDFTRDAIDHDGRGHFLSTWDGQEHEVEVEGETYYLYEQ